MTQDSLLYRQIHPSFIQKGTVTSQAFVPTPKDEGKLSVYDGDLIAAESAFVHYTESLNLVSSGVKAISVFECVVVNLKPQPDPGLFAEHALISFEGLSNGEIRKTGQKLRDFAVSRGWQYQP